MEIALTSLLKRHGHRVQKVLNIMIESPYFYAQDDHDSFLFLRRHLRPVIDELTAVCQDA